VSQSGHELSILLDKALMVISDGERWCGLELVVAVSPLEYTRRSIRM
jgi:hypothetical protein